MMRLDRPKLLCIWLSVSVLLAGLMSPRASVAAGAQNAHYVISGVTVEKVANTYKVVVAGQAPPAYTMYELVDPLRIVLDVADARFGEQVAVPANLPQGPVREVKHIALSTQVPAVARIEVLLADEPAYTVVREGNNIVINFPQTSGGKEMVTSSAIERPVVAGTDGAGAASRLTDIAVDTANPVETVVYLRTDGPVPAFQKAELGKGEGKPARMYIDLPNIKMPGKGIHKSVKTSLSRIRAAQRDKGVRVVFESSLSGLFAYEIEPQADGLLVRVSEPAGVAAPILADLVKAEAPVAQPAKRLPRELPPVSGGAATGKTATMPALAETIVPKFDTAPPKPKVKAAGPSVVAKEAVSVEPPKAAAAASASFGGYAKQKITVDFFKIDLHNVFRLFGEISGQNIVVDEAVSGTLTLALHEVPWDFALDIILNLKELQKEERHNTIVIAPKKKELSWPKTGVENIATKGETAVTQKPDPAIVAQQLKARKNILEAKPYIADGQEAERAGRLEQALAQYETALGLWPDNAQLAGHMASLCLAQLGMPAKAVHYARAVLAHEPTNTEAALQAAIGSAHLQEIGAAKQYFDQAIRGAKPASSALLSYAAFAEEQRSFNGALSLLARHRELYGETLDSLVSKARIYDKQGETAKADATYKAILLSGYDVPEELERYIRGRIPAGN
ncbi:MAG: hypothetical protein ACOY3Z_10940 [Thermodesulfobacteriota bacterium]